MPNKNDVLKKVNRPEIILALQDSILLTQRSIRHITRSMDQLMSVALFPIMFMIMFRYVFGGAINTGGVSYVNFLVAGILVQQLAFGANYTTINMAVDLQQGIVDRFRSLPMASSALLVGHIIADLVRNAVSTVIMLVVAFLVGFRPNANLQEWLLVILLGLLFSLAISWLSAILGLMVKTLEAAQWVGFILIFPLTFVSSAFVPTETMPSVLRVFAENQPVTKVIDAMRAWLVGTPIENSGWVAAIWCIGIILVCAPIATWMFRNPSGK